MKNYKPSLTVTVQELFEKGKGKTYDDFNIANTIYRDIERADIDLSTDLGKEVKLYLPIIISPMDTVVNANVAIQAALSGSIACLHYNHKDAKGNLDIEAQVKEIKIVKRSQSGFIEKPLTVSPNETIATAIQKVKLSLLAAQQLIIFQ